MQIRFVVDDFDNIMRSFILYSNNVGAVIVCLIREKRDLTGIEKKSMGRTDAAVGPKARP